MPRSSMPTRSPDQRTRRLADAVSRIFPCAHSPRRSPAEFCRFALPINLVPSPNRDCKAELLQQVESVGCHRMRFHPLAGRSGRWHRLHSCLHCSLHCPRPHPTRSSLLSHWFARNPKMNLLTLLYFGRHDMTRDREPPGNPVLLNARTPAKAASGHVSSGQVLDLGCFSQIPDSRFASMPAGIINVAPAVIG